MPDNVNKFNSKYGFDLNQVQSISISGSRTLIDKVLIVRQDPITLKYYLEPQDIGIQHGINDTTLTLKDDTYHYVKSFVFLNNSQLQNKLLFSIDVDFDNKTQGILSIQGKLMAKETLVDNTFHNYIFEIGNQLPYDHVTGISYIRPMQNKSLFLYNNGEIKQIDDELYTEYKLTNNVTKKHINPIFSTIAIDGFDFDLSKSPYIEIQENTDNLYEINIFCNPFSVNTQKIEWFGNIEITVAAT
jgi:hypothetical protein